MTSNNKIETTFKLGEKTINFIETKRPKYRLEVDGQVYDLCNAKQIRAAINSTGRSISQNGVYLELTDTPRGTNKQKKLTDVKISRINHQEVSANLV